MGHDAEPERMQREARGYEPAGVLLERIRAEQSTAAEKSPRKGRRGN